jgi:hypothetical protein
MAFSCQYGLKFHHDLIILEVVHTDDWEYSLFILSLWDFQLNLNVCIEIVFRVNQTICRGFNWTGNDNWLTYR